MSRILLSILYLCISAVTYSQVSTFSGSVVEEDTNAKMAGAVVSINGTSLAQTTDENGDFSFNSRIPPGEQVVTVSKEGYEAKYFLINVSEGLKVTVNQVQISMTNKEKKRRKRMNKALAKEERQKEKDRQARIKDAKRDLEKKEKALAKERKRAEKEKRKLKKRNKDVVVSYDNAEVPVKTPVVVPAEDLPDVISPLQIKYANILGITPDEITNIPLYEFIDGWLGTPYLLGGANKEGIDCSSFTQRLFTSVYDLYIERTAESQKDSKYTETFSDTSYLLEGDLVFFGEESRQLITHVGVYLGNNKFINATSRKTNGVSGVKIDDLTDPFWRSIFCCAGRRINNN